jgi:DNA-binding transcriptional MerR regulator
MHPVAPSLPAIPAKRYFTIGEVSELCGVKPYVLRYWEQEFTQLRPMKRRGNRRYYQHHEVLLIRRIRDLLYDQGFTISGARNRLTEAGLEVSLSAASDIGVAEFDDEPGSLQSDVTQGGDSTNHLVRAEAANQPAALAHAALALPANAALRVWPSLPENPNAQQVREELLAIRELLSF